MGGNAPDDTLAAPALDMVLSAHGPRDHRCVGPAHGEEHDMTTKQDQQDWLPLLYLE